MLSLFKKKNPLLVDLIPKGFVDIHSHLLYGLDDGAKTLDDSISMISQLKNIGFSKVITTPHIMEGMYPNTNNTIGRKLEETKIFLNQNNMEIPLHAAAEYMIDHSFYNSLTDEKILTLKDRWVLVELSYLIPPIQLYECIYELLLRGYEPILAHPERYSYFFNNPSEYENLKKAGLYFQLNLLSMVGYYGKETQQMAEKLLAKGFIDFVGTDIHNQVQLSCFYKNIGTTKTTLLEEAMERNTIFKD
jgi:protein-tyrosine phosphatase